MKEIRNNTALSSSTLRGPSNGHQYTKLNFPAHNGDTPIVGQTHNSYSKLKQKRGGKMESGTGQKQFQYERVTK